MEVPVRENHQRGTALVEFVLVLPLLLVILFGIIEFSILFYDKAVITNASREAAREWVEYRDISVVGYLKDIGSDPGTIDGIDDIVQDYCSNRLITFSRASPPVTSIGINDQNNLHDVVNGHAHPIASGDLLIVRVRYNYNFLFLPNFIEELGPSLSLDAKTTMRAE